MKRHPDWILLGAVLLLCALGVAAVYSAGTVVELRYSGDSASLLHSHTVRLLLGAIVLIVMMQVPLSIQMRFARPLFWLSVAALAALVLLPGVREINGARRWITLAGIPLQPSELAKIALVVSLAVHLRDVGSRVTDLGEGFLPAIWRIGLVAGLVMLQPSYSVTLVLLALGAVLLWTSGARIAHLAGVAALSLPILAALLLTSDYRMARVLGHFSPDIHTASSHQAEQAMIAMGHGGLLGTGLGRGTSQLLYLPEVNTDTIFALIGEETGLAGSVLTLGLLLLVVLRGLRAARLASDQGARLVAIGLSTSLGLHGMFHAAVCMGVMPTTGMPFPFVSYGGSATLFNMAAVGMLLQVSQGAASGVPRVAEPIPAWRSPVMRRASWA